MGAGYFYASIVAIVILNINIVSTVKNVKKEQDTSLNAVIGSICSIVIFISVVVICGR